MSMKPKASNARAFGSNSARPTELPIAWMDPMSWRLPSGKALAEFALQSGFLAPLLLGGPSGIMISNIVVSLFGAAYNWPLGAAISFCMLVLVVALLFLSERLEKRWSFS